MEYVYLIFDKSTKLTKIGKSNCPLKRFNQLKTANPSLYLVWYSSLYKEKELHEKYRNLHFSGEWYKLNKQDYIEITQTDKGFPKSLYYKSIDKISKFQSDKYAKIGIIEYYVGDLGYIISTQKRMFNLLN